MIEMKEYVGYIPKKVQAKADKKPTKAKTINKDKEVKTTK